MKNKFNAIILLFLFAALNGCGGAQIKGDFSNEIWHENFAYSLKSPVKLYLFKFTLGDEITDPYLIGEARTGAFNSKSEVVSDIPISDIVHNALKESFRKMGFVIVADQSEADTVVTGEIQQFWVREYASGWAPEFTKATVRYDIIFKADTGKVIWARSIDVEEKSDSFGSFFDATASLLPILKKALSQSIRQISSDPVLRSKFN